MFRPRIVLLCSLAGATLIGLWLLSHSSVRATVLDPSGTFQYFVPLMVPMIAFIFERVEHAREANFFQHGVDFLVFSLAVGRVIGDVPYMSGHTLLLSYALLCSKSKIVRISALLVLAQTLYLKYFVWHDFITSTLDIMLGMVAAWLTSIPNGKACYSLGASSTDSRPRDHGPDGCTQLLSSVGRAVGADGRNARIVGARSDDSSERKTTFLPIAVAPVKATTRC